MRARARGPPPSHRTSRPLLRERGASQPAARRAPGPGDPAPRLRQYTRVLFPFLLPALPLSSQTSSPIIQALAASAASSSASRCSGRTWRSSPSMTRSSRVSGIRERRRENGGREPADGRSRAPAAGHRRRPRPHFLMTFLLREFRRLLRAGSTRSWARPARSLTH